MRESRRQRFSGLTMPGRHGPRSPRSQATQPARSGISAQAGFVCNRLSILKTMKGCLSAFRPWESSGAMTGAHPGNRQITAHAPSSCLTSFPSLASASISCSWPIAAAGCFFSLGSIAKRVAANQRFRRCFAGVYREGMAKDNLKPAGIYFGTNTGKLFGSKDEGDNWALMADNLPPIYSISAAAV